MVEIKPEMKELEVQFPWQGPATVRQAYGANTHVTMSSAQSGGSLSHPMYAHTQTTSNQIKIKGGKPGHVDKSAYPGDMGVRATPTATRHKLSF
jgi:hypothetical protein